MIDATYKIIHFTKIDKFIGVAHNYDHAVLVSTRAWDSYTGAHEELENRCKFLKVRLKYFDGEYTCLGEGEYILKKDEDTCLKSHG